MGGDVVLETERLDPVVEISVFYLHFLPAVIRMSTDLLNILWKRDDDDVRRRVIPSEVINISLHQVQQRFYALVGGWLISNQIHVARRHLPRPPIQHREADPESRVSA